MQVEGERARGEGVVRGGDAAEAESHVVGDVQPGRGAREGVWLVFLEPEDLAQAEDGLQGEAASGRRGGPGRRAVEPLGLGLARPSNQAMMSRVGSPSASSGTAASAKLATAMLATRPGSSSLSVTRRKVAAKELHSSSGSWSALPGFGYRVGVGELAPSTARPLRSKATTLMFVVPTSAPIRSGSRC